MSKVILITGASSGIGKASAKQLIKDGHIVYGAARRVSKMKDLEEAGGRIIQMDVTDHKSAELAVQNIIKENGPIDVLINNAGYAIYGSVEDTSMEDIRRQFDVNFFGVVNLTQHVLPHMRKNGSGKIINVSSVGGKIYTPLGAFYHATKHAIEGWSDSLRLELKDKGIDVVIIEPGIIHTEFTEVMFDPMLERSKGGPYESLANRLAEASKDTYSPKNSSPPEVIAKVIADATNAQKPKTRYAKGKLAKLMIFLRKVLSDRMFDKTVMSQV